MKKSLVFILMLALVLSVSLYATGSPKTYTQKLACTGGTGNMLDYIANASTTTNADFRATATISSDPLSLVTTGVQLPAVIKICKIVANPCISLNVANLSTTTPYANGDIIHITVTYIGSLAPYTGQSVSWDVTVVATSMVYTTTTQIVPPLFIAPTGYDVQVNSNVPGMIYKDAVSTGFRAPHLFTEQNGSISWSVENIPTMVTPLAQATTDAATLTFNYANLPIQDPGVSTAVVAAGPVTLPTVAGVAEVAGTVNAPGLLVVTQFEPNAKVADYAGYNSVLKVVQVWASDVSMLNGAALDISATPGAHGYFAYIWGSNLVPAPPTAGYALPGFAPHFPGFLTINDLAGASYVGGVLHIANIPVWAAKGPGTFELVLSNGPSDLPVVLTNFQATITADLFVNLNWTTASETNNLGFNLLRSNDAVMANAEVVNFGIITGSNSTSGSVYNYTDNTVTSNSTYYYWLEMVSMNGVSTFSDVRPVTVGGVTPPPVVPTTTVLRAAYPNPFNANTNIAIDVKAGEKATVTVYNVLGQTVKTWVRGEGSHNLNWDRRDNNGSVCGSGIYFYKLSSPSVNATKKMVVVK